MNALLTLALQTWYLTSITKGHELQFTLPSLPVAEYCSHISFSLSVNLTSHHILDCCLDVLAFKEFNQVSILLFVQCQADFLAIVLVIFFEVILICLSHSVFLSLLCQSIVQNYQYIEIR